MRQGDGSEVTVGGYFRSIGVDACSPEEAAGVARRVAVEPDGESGWKPPETCAIGEVEVALSEGHDRSGPDGVFFKSGRVFYPPKRWWQFWK
jgi:hypothetical protein